MATIAEQLTSLANTKTAIKDAIVAKGVSVADTDPFSSYAGKIEQISGGGAPATKFGVSIDNLLGNVDAEGVYSPPAEGFVFNGTGIKTFSRSGVSQGYGAYSFFGKNWTRVDCPDLISIGDGTSYIAGPCESMFASAFSPTYVSNKIVDLPKLETISGQYAAQSMFYQSYISSINLPKLTTINGTYAANGMFAYNRIPNVSLPSLTTITGSTAAYQMFNQSNVETVDLPLLSTVSGSGACRQMFAKNTDLTRVDFPSLTAVETNSFGTSSSNAIFANCTGLQELHFRADAQELIESLSAYQYKFGASNATIYFDL